MSKKDNQEKYFCAIVKPENKIVTGIFIRLQESDFKEPEFIFYKTKAHKEKNIKEIFLVKNLVTFKIIESKDESILHKFGFIWKILLLPNIDKQLRLWETIYKFIFIYFKELKNDYKSKLQPSLCTWINT